MLSFEPAPISACGPACAYHGSSGDITTSWGGSVHYHEADHTYYMFMAEMVGQGGRVGRAVVAVSSPSSRRYTILVF